MGLQILEKCTLGENIYYMARILLIGYASRMPIHAGFLGQPWINGVGKQLALHIMNFWSIKPNIHTYMLQSLDNQYIVIEIMSSIVWYYAYD